MEKLNLDKLGIYLFDNGESYGDWNIEYTLVGPKGFKVTKEVILDFYKSVNRDYREVNRYEYNDENKLVKTKVIQEDRWIGYDCIRGHALQKEWKAYLAKKYNLHELKEEKWWRFD